MPLLVTCQAMTFSTPLLITCPCKLLSNSSTSPNSQSFIYLVNTGFQQPPYPPYSHIWFTQASLSMAIKNNSGKATAKGNPTPPILPKPYPPTISYPKNNPIVEFLPPIPNSLPKTHPIFTHYIYRLKHSVLRMTWNNSFVQLLQYTQVIY